MNEWLVHRKEGYFAICGTRIPEGSGFNEVFTLVDLFHWAKDRDYIAVDPTVKLKKPHRVVYDAPRCLNMQEYLVLKAKIDDPVFSDIVDFYLLTGIRRGDGKNTSSENFDFERMVTTLLQHKQGSTKKSPIGRDLYGIVRRLIDRVGPGQPLVQMHKDDMTTTFAKAHVAAGLQESITFHSLRHTFASWLVEIGTHIRTVQELVGHSCIQSTQLYVRAFDPNKRAAIDKLNLPKAQSP